MQPTLAERAAKILDEFGDLPLTTVQENSQFFDDVLNFCGAVIDAAERKRQPVT